MKTGKARILARCFFCLLPALALASTAGCSKPAAKTAKAAEPVLTVSVEPAASRTLASKLTLTGAIAAWQPLAVSPAISGLQVTEVLAEEGRRVAKGALLARLDDRALQAQLADARARLASAEASVAKARFPSRSEDVSSGRAAVAEAEARLASAQGDYGRYEILRAEGGVTAAEMDAKRTALASARAALQQARDRLNVMVVGGRREDVRMAEATLAQARAAVSQIEIQLSQTRIVAPAAGLILKKDVLLGDVAALGKAMFTLARDNRLEMAANVAEADLPRLAPGQTVAIASDALPGLKAVGKVREISPSLSGTSRLATAKIDLPAGTGFKPGMFARASVALGSAPALAVSTEAVVNQDGKARVFVVTEGVAHVREVVTGDSVGAWTPIVAGLTPGEPVAVEGAGFLKEGDVVTVAKPAPAGEGGR